MIAATTTLLAAGLATVVILIIVVRWRAAMPSWDGLDRLGALLLVPAIFTLSLLVVTVVVVRLAAVGPLPLPQNLLTFAGAHVDFMLQER